MNCMLGTVLCVLIFACGILIDRFVLHFDRISGPTFSNPLPKVPYDLTVEEHRCLSLYLEEWKLVIQTQMHFNDIVLRFRTMALTAFVTLIAAIIALSKIATLNRATVILLMCMPLILWTAAGALDLCYYHRLLLGAVTQAEKYDNSEIARKYCLFGMTTCISSSIHVPTSNYLVLSYYILPGLLTAAILIINFFRMQL
jgi:hypothetical protein